MQYWSSCINVQSVTLNTFLERYASEHAWWTKFMEMCDRHNFLYPLNIGIVGSNIATKIHMIYAWLLIYFYCIVPFGATTDSSHKESHKMTEDVKDKSYSEKYILNTTEDNFSISFLPTKSVIQL